MSSGTWETLLAAIVARSGEAMESVLSEDVVLRIEEITGARLPADLPPFVTNLPRVKLDAGLSDDEIAHAEARYGIHFPPDLRELLQTALPCGEGFPDWRSGEEAVLRDWLRLPLDGILFDIEQNGFWLPECGPRPETLDEALRHASDLVAAAPKLIPIYNHRMIADEPCVAGNPVFSVHQTDIIYFGFNLADYFRHEFKLPDREPWPGGVRPIRFWDIPRFQEVCWSNGSSILDDRAVGRFRQ